MNRPRAAAPQHPRRTGPGPIGADVSLDLAVELARTAGARLLHLFTDGDIRPVTKSPGERSSAADVEADRYIVDTIRTALPGHRIVAEESGATGPESDHTWIVDPLDGTHNFLRGRPDWGVSIAYAYRGRVMTGVFHALTTNALYTATRGGGAHRDGHRLQVRPAPHLAQSLAICSASPPPWKDTARRILDGLWGSVLDIRITGCGAAALCQVAEGSADVFAEVDGEMWDYAAGALIVEEAGGTLTDYAGSPVTSRSADVVAAASRSLHAQARAAMGGERGAPADPPGELL
ncbi:inositol monophosphatase family protein [Streptomyces flavidovirens]|uniref:inositol monophosphatase family protein n=1 Tax=Streptomyces flavidovirens TaxID=67298 RepID=UPI0036746E0D